MDLKNRVLVLVTAYNPTNDLIDYIRDLNVNDLDTIVVNDGSEEKFSSIFDKLEDEGSIVLKHAKKMGRGRSIKTAINHILNIKTLLPYNTIITTDSSGMYTADSVIRLSKEIEKNPNTIMLTRQNVNYNNIAYKKRILNQLSSITTRLVYGKKIMDNTTGLRAYPIDIIDQMLVTKGEKDEYETSFLVHAFNNNIKVKEIRLDNNYHNENKGHTEFLVNNIKIFSQLISPFMIFALASFISAGFDLFLFKNLLTILTFFGLEKSILLFLITILISKSIASFINLLLNKNYKFKNSGRLKKTLYKNSLMSLIKTLISSYIIYLVVSKYGYNELNVKIVVDIILFLVFYKIYYAWVYSIKNKKVKE